MILRPWLWLPASWAHTISPYVLRALGRLQNFQTLTWQPFTWHGLTFTNRLGTAGGVDKNGLNIQDWWTFGPGFVEVGTVTPLPQMANPGLVVDRSLKSYALWNHMGFPNTGLEHLKKQMNHLERPHFTPIFVNIGKNRETPLEKAHEDYIRCLEGLYLCADAFVINISSPNTPGLRDLTQPELLKTFLSPIIERRDQLCLHHQTPPVPILLKLSPDIERTEFEEVILHSLALGIDGWILTNTSQTLREGTHFPSSGGVSGRPLAAKAKLALSWIIEVLGPSRKGRLIVSCGGVLSPEDVFERIEMGADLVQTYSGLIFNGPFFFRKVAKWAEQNVGLR